MTHGPSINALTSLTEKLSRQGTAYICSYTTNQWVQITEP